VLSLVDLRKHISSELEDPALQTLLDAAYEAIGGRTGAAIADQFVVSTAMKNGVYSLAHGGAMPTAGTRRVTVTHASATGADTLGGVTVAGLSRTGQAISDVIVPLADARATGALLFSAVSSVTGAGWAINGGNDTLVVGCEALGVTDMLRSGSGCLLMLNRTASEILSVTEDGILLSPLDYELRSSGLVLERLRTGPSPRYWWLGRIDVTYTMGDEAERDRVVIALVELELNHAPGLMSQTIGQWSETYGGPQGQSYEEARGEILASLGGAVIV
jgi:hypothetical protein